VLYNDIVGIRIAESGDGRLSLDVVAESFGCAYPQIICLRRPHGVEVVRVAKCWKDFKV
jgi:hypothetical protein